MTLFHSHLIPIIFSFFNLIYLWTFIFSFCFPLTNTYTAHIRSHSIMLHPNTLPFQLHLLGICKQEKHIQKQSFVITTFNVHIARQFIILKCHKQNIQQHSIFCFLFFLLLENQMKEKIRESTNQQKCEWGHGPIFCFICVLNGRYFNHKFKDWKQDKKNDECKRVIKLL